MPISRGDRFKLVCHIAKIDKLNAFKVAYWKQEKQRGDDQTAYRALQKSFNGWCKGRALNTASEEKVLGALTATWPDSVPAPELLLASEVTVLAFLNLCKLDYEEIEPLLSDEAKKEWSAGHHNLHFMKTLDDQSKGPRAKALLPSLKGTYRLYRRHSMLPGLVREYFIVDEIKDGHCEGWYIQYARAHAANLIPFNAFFCEFYVMAFGAHQAVGRRTEIVTVSVLVENAFSDTKLICDAHNKYFLGLLTGIYDYGNILLAERVLIEKQSSDILIEKKVCEGGGTKPIIGEFGPMHIHQGSDRKYLSEYYKAVDVIDNSLDGQTLAVRPERLELVRG